jgi:hypothetical protein
MSCFAVSSGYSFGNGFPVDRCLGLEASLADSRCDRLINILGWFENGFWRWRNDVLLNGGYRR